MERTVDDKTADRWRNTTANPRVYDQRLISSSVLACPNLMMCPLKRSAYWLMASRQSVGQAYSFCPLQKPEREREREGGKWSSCKREWWHCGPWSVLLLPLPFIHMRQQPCPDPAAPCRRKYCRHGCILIRKIDWLCVFFVSLIEGFLQIWSTTLKYAKYIL
jgi:hypothetical protein